MSKFSSQDCWKAIKECPGFLRKTAIKKQENIQEQNLNNGKNQLNQLPKANSQMDKDEIWEAITSCPGYTRNICRKL